MRKCGSCTLCCTTMGVPSIEKEAGTRCQHLCGGKCGIYNARPQECKDFNCLWLQGAIPEELRPNVVKAVVSANTHGNMLVVHVLPQHQGAHTQGKLSVWLKAVSKRVPIMVCCGDERTLMDDRLVQLRTKNVSDHNIFP